MILPGWICCSVPLILMNVIVQEDTRGSQGSILLLPVLIVYFCAKCLLLLFSILRITTICLALQLGIFGKLEAKNTYTHPKLSLDSINNMPSPSMYCYFYNVYMHCWLIKYSLFHYFTHLTFIEGIRSISSHEPRVGVEWVPPGKIYSVTRRKVIPFEQGKAANSHHTFYFQKAI